LLPRASFFITSLQSIEDDDELMIKYSRGKQG
jgi:hypothetical protein